MSEPIKLTQYSHAAGCGCKMAPAVLEEILRDNQSSTSFKQLLIGNHSKDDAAVWDLGDGQSLISTVDFFMPIVDDAYDFGRIAATNAISDVYAMGGKPIMATALLGWPVNSLPLELAARVLAGARAVCEQAGIPVAGGHSIDSKEPLFGLSVNGLVQTNHIKANSTAKDGDFLFLTKPLGTGIMATAVKRGLAQPGHVATVVESMCQLNKIGMELAAIKGVNALTDVTGFGLYGHLIEMCEGSGVSADLYLDKIPYFDFISTYTDQNCSPDSTYRNWNAIEKKVSPVDDMFYFQLLNDPQTSGGLLVSVEPKYTELVVDLFKQNGLDFCIDPIGKMTVKKDFSIQVMI
ncbi:MAG: selenide, water dikinase SelD [Bacteroidota bacterium]|nr:selenide, water dikinase SelD [Bacteroidota bacterium]